MKRNIFIGIFVLLVLGFLFNKYQEGEKIKTIKKGWYAEVVIEPSLRVREDTTPISKQVGKLKTGAVVKIYDMKIHSDQKNSGGGFNYIWYSISNDPKKPQWIATPKDAKTDKDKYLKVYNNPHDISEPLLKYKEEFYKTKSVDTITYDHLIIEDDKTPRSKMKISHELFHEKGLDIAGDKIDQYWIRYTVEDEAGKKASKLQKIIFDELPTGNIKDFSLR